MRGGGISRPGASLDHRLYRALDIVVRKGKLAAIVNRGAGPLFIRLVAKSLANLGDASY